MKYFFFILLFIQSLIAQEIIYFPNTKYTESYSKYYVINNPTNSGIYTEGLSHTSPFFSIKSTMWGYIEPGKSDSFQIIINPSKSIGLKIDTITSKTSLGTTKIIVYALKMAPLIETVRPFTFYNTMHYTTRDTTLEISNIGNDTLFITKLDIVGSGFPFFTLNNNKNFTYPIIVLPSNKYYLPIQFEAGYVNTISAELNIYSNNLDGEPYRLLVLARVFPTGVTEIPTDHSGDISIYPSIVSIHLNILMSQKKNIFATIYNTAGQVIDRFLIDQNFTTWIPKWKIPNGIYFLQIYNKLYKFLFFK